MTWDVRVLDEVVEWLLGLDDDTYDQVAAGIDMIAADGPTLGRPLVDRITGSRIHNLKELRPGSAGASEIRILFVFDPARAACSPARRRGQVGQLAGLVQVEHPARGAAVRRVDGR